MYPEETAKAFQALFDAIKKRTRENAEIMICPSLMVNPKCTKGDPCSDSSADKCRWSYHDDDVDFTCDCDCHERAKYSK